MCHCFQVFCVLVCKIAVHGSEKVAEWYDGEDHDVLGYGGRFSTNEEQHTTFVRRSLEDRETTVVRSCQSAWTKCGKSFFLVGIQGPVNGFVESTGSDLIEEGGERRI